MFVHLRIDGLQFTLPEIVSQFRSILFVCPLLDVYSIAGRSRKVNVFRSTPLLPRLQKVLIYEAFFLRKFKHNSSKSPRK